MNSHNLFLNLVVIKFKILVNVVLLSRLLGGIFLL